MAEKVKVEFLGNDVAVAKLIERQNKLLDKQERRFEAVAKVSKRGSDAASGSIAKMNRVLRKTEDRLKRVAVESDEFRQLANRAQVLRGKIDAANASLRKVGASGTSAVGMITTRVLGAVTATQALSTALRVATGEYDEMLKRDQATRQFTTTRGQAAAALRLNFTPDEQFPTFRSFMAEVERQGAGKGFKLDDLKAPVATALSSGAESNQAAITTAIESMQLTAGQSETALAIAGGALDLAAAAQTTNTRGTSGQVLQAQSTARVADIGLFARSAGGAVSALTKERQNLAALGEEQALELFTIINADLKDQSGPVARTATRIFTAALNNFRFDEDQLQRIKDPEERAAAVRFQKTRDFEEKTGILEENEALRNRFIGTIREGEGKASISAFVAGDLKALEEKIETRITDVEGGVATFNAVLADVQDVTRSERRQNVREAKTGVVTGEDLAAEIRSEARTALAEVLEGTGEQPGVNLPGIDSISRFRIRRIQEAGAGEGRDPVATDIAIVREILRDNASGIGPLSQSDTRRMEILLEQLLESQRDLTRLMQERGREFLSGRTLTGQAQPGPVAVVLADRPPPSAREVSASALSD